MRLAASVRDAVIEHARETAPNEACGLLGGVSTPEPTVLESIRTPNVARPPSRRFEIDPEALLAGRETIAEAGYELLGFYHSHPDSPAEPSATDLELARWDDTYMLIVSLSGAAPSLGAWEFVGETFHPEPVEVDVEPSFGDST